MFKKQILIIFFQFSMISFSYAWWGAGHLLVDQIAEDNLTLKTKEITRDYINEQVIYPGTLLTSKNTSSFVESGLWCDYIKNDEWEKDENKKINSMLHYINPITDPKGKKSRSLSAFNLKVLIKSNSDSGKYNALTGLLSSIKTLIVKQSSAADKSVALRFIIHLIGDIHAPLHAAAPFVIGIDTKGGNKILLKNELKVQEISVSDRRKTAKIENLHEFWDAGAGAFLQMPYSKDPKGMTETQRIYIKNEANAIIDKYKNNLKINSRIDSQSITEWFIESNMIASHFINTDKLRYFKNAKNPEKVIIKFKSRKSYVKSAQNISLQQVYIAGMRLAKLLNAIFDPKKADRNYVQMVEKIKNNKKIKTLKELFPQEIVFQIK